MDNPFAVLKFLGARQRLRLAVFGIAALAALESPVMAYNETGHYYTVAAVMHHLIPKLSAERASFVAFCAQLPDIANELDATKVYRSMAGRHPLAFVGWATRGKSWDESVGRMVAVQQLLHGLTGGKAPAMQGVAERIVGTLANVVQQAPSRGDAQESTALCALGLALHLYGDAFAHRRLDDRQVMYPTGRGHAADIHRPDYILYEPTEDSHLRAETWKGCLLAAAGVLGKFSLDRVLADQKVSEVMSLPSSPTKPGFANTYGERSISTILARGLPLPAFKVPPEQNPSGPCQQYVNDRFNEGHFGALATPRCRDVWNLFRRVAEPAFTGATTARDSQFNLGFADPVFAP